MTGVEIFRSTAPELLAAAAAGDPNLSVQVRQAMRELAHWDLPIGLKFSDDMHRDAWVGLLPHKLQGVNQWMNDWRRRKQLRQKWGGLLWKVICAGERVASRLGCEELGRAPKCGMKMAVQVVRLVPSVREFIRDDDGLASAPKQLYDAMQDVGLIREDRREWLAMQPVVQDVSPIAHTAVTVFFLWPAPVAGLLTGAPNADRRAHPLARGESPTDDRGTEEGRAVPGVRRRARARAVDV